MKYLSTLLMVIFSVGVIGPSFSAAAAVYGPAIGLGVSLPLITAPPLMITTAITFIQFYAEAPLTVDMAARLGLRLYLSATMLRSDLTSTEGSLFIFLNRGLARFYVGGGIGAFPYEAFTAFGNSYGPGLLLSLHQLAGFRVTTGMLSIFAELKYEMMPQSICLIDIDPAVDGDYEEVCDGFGAVSSFQITIGGMVSFGGGAGEESE